MSNVSILSYYTQHVEWSVGQVHLYTCFVPGLCWRGTFHCVDNEDDGTAGTGEFLQRLSVVMFECCFASLLKFVCLNWKRFCIKKFKCLYFWSLHYRFVNFFMLCNLLFNLFPESQKKFEKRKFFFVFYGHVFLSVYDLWVFVCACVCVWDHLS